MKSLSFWIVFYGVVTLYSLNSFSITLYFDQTKQGEVSMMEGVEKELIKKGEQVKKITNEKDLKKMPPDTLLTVGQSGIDLIKKKELSSQWRITLMSHLIFDETRNIIDQIDSLFLPAYLNSPAILPDYLVKNSRKIVWTSGVATNIDKNKLIEEYHQMKNDLKLMGEDPLVVVLGGDVEKSDGSISRFTQENAISLAQWVNKEKKRTIVVLNGPRTGKYDKNLKLESSAHRDGKMDQVTTSFLNELSKKKNNLKGEKTVLVFDFQFGKVSRYQAVLGALLETGKKGEIMIPGESNSMLEDVTRIGLLPQTLIYRHFAMNDLNNKNVDYIKAHYQVKVLDQNLKREKELSKKVAKSDGEVENPNIQIAKKIMDLVGKKR